MAIEIGVFFLHVCILGAAVLISLRLIWGKDRPSKMYPFVIPVFAMAILLGFLMGKAGAFDLWAMIGSFFAGVLILLVTFAIVAKRQMMPLFSVLAGLAGSAKGIAGGATDISTVSQDLSEGSSMQLAAVADTSASLEELSSMTNRNVEMSRQANGLMSDTQQTIDRMSAFMKDLTVSMGEISKASEETSKIIKSIDEIAFQTNLLALNAAVEAARAGAAGAGFAVVANEVRNLAMRSAEAARNTADLIEGTVKKIKDGATLVNKTNQEFTGVAASASKIGNLIEEITAVSQEQVQAIKKIDGVIREIDHAIGQNSALADEFDAAADDTAQQIDHMRLHLRRMASLIGWSGKTQPLMIRAREDLSGTAKRQSLPGGKTDRKNLTLPAPARTAEKK